MYVCKYEDRVIIILYHSINILRYWVHSNLEVKYYTVLVKPRSYSISSQSDTNRPIAYWFNVVRYVAVLYYNVVVWYGIIMWCNILSFIILYILINQIICPILYSNFCIMYTLYFDTVLEFFTVVFYSLLYFTMFLNFWIVLYSVRLYLINLYCNVLYAFFTSL